VETFTKRRPDAPEGFFEAEAAGLRWLRVPGGVAVAEVVEVTATSLTTIRVAEGPATRDSAERFGAELVRTHDAGAAAFGVLPDGYFGPAHIGSLAMPMPDPADAPGLRWGTYYGTYRVLDPARRAVERGGLAPGDLRVFEALAKRLDDGAFDDGAPVARLHGDLWAGNVLFTGRRAVLIDPAAHGGHRLADLAMLGLFGAPHLDAIWSSYEEASGHLPDGWRELIALHQVNPLLVHAALFGGGYGSAAVRAASRYL
jgi:fructosamine-3-kinase